MAGNANWRPKESNVKSKQLVVNVSKNGLQKLENIQLDLDEVSRSVLSRDSSVGRAED